MSAASTPAPPPGVERDYSLARLTTVRTGGPADFFARPSSEEELVELLAWARQAGTEVGVVGSGSNLLVADEGFRGLAIKLDGELAEFERDDEHLVAGGARAAAFGGGQGRFVGAFGPRVRDQHPGHRWRRGER